MKKKNRLLRFAFIMAFLVSFGLGHDAWAAVYTWNGSGSALWATPANWTPAAPVGGPAAGDDVIIVLAGTQITAIPASTTISSLTMTSGGVTITPAGALTITGDLTISADVLAMAGNALSVGGTTTIAAGASLTSTGGVKTFTDLVDNSGTLTLTGSTATMGAGLTNTLGTTTVGTSLAITGDLIVTAGSVVTAGNILSVTGTTTIAAGASLTSTGGVKTFTGEVSLTATSTLDLTGTTASVTTSSSGLNLLTTGANVNLTLTGSSSVILPATVTALNKLVIEKTGVATVTAPGAACAVDSAMVNSGKLILNNALANILTANDYLYIANDATLEAGAANSALVIGNVFSSGASAIFTTNAGLALTLGSAATVTSDFTLPSTMTDLYRLTINRATTSSVTLGTDSLNIADNYVITSGKLIVGLNSLRLGGATTASSIAASGTLDISGSQIYYNGAFHPTVLGTITTNSSTSMTYNTSQAGALTFPTGITNLNNLTVNTTAAQTFTNGANLTLAGALTITSGTYVPGAFTLTVNGAFTMSSANAVLTEDGAEIILNGPISIGHAANLALSTNTCDLTIGGTGSISMVPVFSNTVLGTLTMNRPGAVFPYTATGAATIDNLTITNGTVSLPSAQTYEVTGNTVVSSGGILDRNNQTQELTFTGSISGPGTINIETADVVFDGNYNFTGELITDASTDIEFATAGTDVLLQASAALVDDLIFTRTATLTLSGNITIDNSVTLTDGTIVTGANTIDISTAGAAFAPASGTINANNGTLIFRGANGVTFTNITLVANNATNIELLMNGAVVMPAVGQLPELNNLIINPGAAQNITLLESLIANGNVEIGDNGTLLTAGYTLTVYGTFSNSGTFTEAAGTNLILYGAYTGDGTWTTPNLTNLFVYGTGDQLSIPAGVTALNTITVNRANGARINIATTIGAGVAGNAITLTNGDLDLNGNDITLGAATARLSENPVGGSTITNTGSDGAYIITDAASTQAQNIASGIGLTAIAGNDAAFQVARYPKARTVAGVNTSVARYYNLVDAGVGPLTEVEFKYDNTELGTNSAGSLKLYYVTATDNFLNLSDIDSSTVTSNTPGDAYGKVKGTSFSANIAANMFFALASASGSTGVVRIFNNTSGNGKWETASNWNPSGVPTINDDVAIGPYSVTIGGNGITYYCKSISLESPSSSLQPYSAVSSGDTVNLIVMGNININFVGANIDGANNYGRINFQVGDGVTPVTCDITPSQDYSPLAGGNGFSTYNLTINNAAVSQTTAHKIRVSKNLSVEGTSVFSQVAGGTLVMYGGSGTQTISVASIASLDLQNLELENNANVSTTSNFIVRENIKIDGPSDMFTATGGAISFQNASPVDGWNVFPGGILKLWNVDFIGVDAYTPNGDAQIQGDFTFSNTAGTLIPDDGTITFSGANQKNLINTADPANLQFYNLAVAPGASVATSSSFSINGDIDVQTNASLVADNGTITFPGQAPTPSLIKNASDHTLVFNNLAIADQVLTSDNWKIVGNLAVTGTLTADKGTITFDNDVVKTISGAGTINFYKLSIADQSIITTAVGFNIENNTTNPNGAGIEVLGTGSFSASAGTVTFTTASDPGVGYTKTISKSTSGTLKFYQLAIATSVNNAVTTASDFEIIGTANAFVNNNAGLGGIFTATAGTITFSGTGAVIASALANATAFNNLLVNNITLTLAEDDFINIIGNLTVNGASGIFTTNNTTPAGLIKFNGSVQQNINGTSTQAVPVIITRMEINKTSGATSDKSVVLGLDFTLFNDAASLLQLNSGYLNLGSKKLTNGLGDIIYSHLGAINGATGTFYNVAIQDANVLFRDELFTVDNEPTLYNLTEAAQIVLDGDLTINGTLALNGGASDMAIGTNTLTQLGNLTRTTGTFATASGNLLLAGTGSTTALSNNFFGAGTNCDINLEIARAEVLSGNLDINSPKALTINTGINNFDLSIYKLTTLVNSTINRVSGSINAGTNSMVDFGTGVTTIPSNLFVNNTCFNVNFTGGTGRTLAGDLRVEGTMAGTLQNITTGDNILTYGPSAVLPAFTNAAHVIGNLRRTVSATATRFDIGSGTVTTYRPVELNFATAGNTQEITVLAKNQEPTYGRAGCPDNAVDLLYTFTPVGTNALDSMKVKFQWTPTLEGDGIAATIINGSFPAKWENNAWTDYRSELMPFASSNPRVLTMSNFPVANPAALKGEWAIFNATEDTDVAKDKAISKTSNKVVITNIEPSPVLLNKPFKVTVQLQDQYGQPITVTAPFYVSVNEEVGTGTQDLTGVITAGNSMVELNGLYTAAEANKQLRADTTGSSENWQSQVSESFNVLSALPGIQASNILLSNITNTTATINWTIGAGSAGTIIVLKADTLLIEGQEFPVSGTSYSANDLFGAGSPLGDAVVVNNASSAAPFTVKGLSPNTKYYVYAFAYNGTNGTENYRISVAANNPKILNTTGSIDDDAALGSNDTRVNSKTIGTNTPVTGTLASSTDEDWFNFSVTNATPNVRTQLYGLTNNYNIEVYDASGRRIRRGIRTATGTESPVVNDLPAGTYTVRIYSADGSYSTTNTYTLKVGTKSSEIFSVTP